jgi:hypothetical protein
MDCGRIQKDRNLEWSSGFNKCKDTSNKLRHHSWTSAVRLVATGTNNCAIHCTTYVHNIHIRTMYVKFLDSSVVMTTDYGLDGRGSVAGRGKIFLFSTTLSPSLYGMLTGATFPGSKGLCMKLAHLHLAPRSRREVYTPPHVFRASSLTYKAQRQTRFIKIFVYDLEVSHRHHLCNF